MALFPGALLYNLTDRGLEENLDTAHITHGIGGGGQGSDKRLRMGTELVSRYLIQDVVGVGGMSSVYRARDMHFPNVVKLVAVKEMINQASDPLVRQTIVQNFEREANILVTLSHPSIPKIYDYFTFQERSYLVLEFVHGKDLEALLNETPNFFPEEQVIGWAIEMCEVLDYLHNHQPEPIIFRDVKPQNIMITDDGHVVLIDFGIAKMFNPAQKGTMIGTEGYSPPEQYRGEATQQADIYALGASLHHILTRRNPQLEPPFSFAERPIRKINPAISPELEAVVMTALQYSPQDRFSSAGEMRDALMAIGSATGVLPPKPVSQPKSPNNDVQPKTTLVDGQEIKPLWQFKCEDEIRGSPVVESGTLFVGAYDNNVYALNTSNGEFIWKFPAEGGVTGKPLIHEGDVYFGSEDRLMYAVSTRTGKLVWSYSAEGPIHSSPLITEGHLIFGCDDGNLYAVHLVTNRCIWKVPGSAPVRSTPSTAQGLIYFGSESGDVLCVDLRGQTRWRFKSKRAVTSTPLVGGNTVYFTSLDGTLYAMDAKSGWPVWRFRMGKGSVSSPCMTDKYIFAGSADGYIYCIDSGTAKEVWRFETGFQVSGSPVIYKDSLYCGSADGSLYCLEFRNGRLRWKYTTGGAITGTPFIENDVIFIGSWDHHVYAFPAY